MTEDLSHPQLKGIALGTEKLFDLYRWDSFMTISMQCSNSLWAAVSCPKSCPARPKRQTKNPAPFSSEDKTTMSCQSFTWVSNRNTHSQQEKIVIAFSFFLISSTSEDWQKQDPFLSEKQTNKIKSLHCSQKTIRIHYSYIHLSIYLFLQWCLTPAQDYFPSLHGQRSSVSKTLLNRWQVCVQPQKTEKRSAAQRCTQARSSTEQVAFLTARYAEALLTCSIINAHYSLNTDSLSKSLAEVPRRGAAPRTQQ